VLLHIWNVRPQAEATLVEQLAEMLRRVSDDPALVSARILASPDRRSVAALVEMRCSEIASASRSCSELASGWSSIPMNRTYVSQILHRVNRRSERPSLDKVGERMGETTTADTARGTPGPSRGDGHQE
jgi:hypothetical protein